MISVEKIIKRLEIIKNYILLEDLDEISMVAKKLNEFNDNEDLALIILDIESSRYSTALNRIQDFIYKYQQVAIRDDCQLISLRLKLKSLENRLLSYTNEKIELEKILSQYKNRHTIELGVIIKEILALRKTIFIDDEEKHNEAEKDENNYHEQFDIEIEKKVISLTEDEKTELKSNFRKASLLCHPDRVKDDLKLMAEESFIELINAYELNDLEKVSTILKNLENGLFSKSIFEEITEIEVLKSKISQLETQLEIVVKEIDEIKNSKTYQTISEIEDLDKHFIDIKERLSAELDRLKKEQGGVKTEINDEPIMGTQIEYLFFDTETTGLPRNWKAPVTDIENWPRLVQLAYLAYNANGEIIEKGDFIIKPEGYTIPTESSQIHGISTEKAMQEGHFIKEVLKSFQDLVNNSEYLVAHNMSFDEKIVGSEFLRNNFQNTITAKKKICTMISTTNFCRISGPYGFKWPKLSELHFKLFNTRFEEAHNAFVDIQVTAKCFWELKKMNKI